MPRRYSAPPLAFPDPDAAPVTQLGPLPVSRDAVDAEGLIRAAKEACDAHPAVIAEREASRTLADKDAARRRAVSLWTRTMRAWTLANPDHDGQPVDPIGRVDRQRAAAYGASKFAAYPDDPPPF